MTIIELKCLSKTFEIKENDLLIELYMKFSKRSDGEIHIETQINKKNGNKEFIFVNSDSDIIKGISNLLSKAAYIIEEETKKIKKDL